MNNIVFVGSLKEVCAYKFSFPTIKDKPMSVYQCITYPTCFKLFLLASPTWSGQCVEDNSKRFLQKKIFVTNNSQSTCIKACKDSGYQLAGVQHTNQCFCDNTPTPSSDLTMIVTMFAPEIPIKSVGAVGG